MECEEISDFLHIHGGFHTFSISITSEVQILLCFTSKPEYSDGEHVLYRKWNISSGQVSTKSLKFVPEKTIKSHSFSPDGKWQALLTGQGGIYIFPVKTILGEIQDSHKCWNNLDATNLNTRLSGQPECILWWRSFLNDDVGIVGFKMGQVLLIDLSNGSYLTQVDVSGHVDLCELVRTNDNGLVYCLITSRTGNQWKQTLEKQHTALDTRHFDSPGGFEEVTLRTSPVTIYSRNGLENSKAFEPVKMYQFPQSVQLRYQSYENKHFVSGFNRNRNRLHIYDAGALESPALFIFRICETAIRVLIHETLIYAVYRGNDEELRVAIYCRQHAHCPDGDDSSITFSSADALRAKLADFSIGRGNLIDLFLLPNTMKPIFSDSYDLSQWTNIPSVLAVTSKRVFLIHQKYSYDEKFLDLLLEQQRQRDAEWLGVGLKLDLNWLYEIAAEKICSDDVSGESHVIKNRMKTAGDYFDLARTAISRRIQCMSTYFCTKDLLRYLSGLIRNPDQLTSIDRSCVANAMVLCFARILAEDKKDQSTADKFRAFILNNFHFNQMKAAYILLDFGLIPEALFLCRERGLLVEAMQHLRECQWACKSSRCEFSMGEDQRQMLINKERNEVLRVLGPEDMETVAQTCPQLLESLTEDCIRWCNKDLDDDVLDNLLECFSPEGITFQRLIGFLEEPDNRDRSNTVFNASLMSSLDSLPGNESNIKTVISTILRGFIAILLKKQPTENKHLKFITMWEKAKYPSNVARQGSFSSPPLSAAINQMALAVSYGGSFHILGGPELPTRGFKRQVREVSCGLRHALVVDSNGMPFSCGNNMFGQLGIDRSCTTFPETSLWRPNLIPLIDMPTIRSISAGHYHSLALTADNVVLAWGWNVHGQLGLGHVEDSWKPEAVELAGGKAVAICGGAHHSMLLRDDGRLFLFGGNQFGQLGRDDLKKSSVPLRLTQITTPIKLIATKYFHNLCVTSDNRLYQWGIHPKIWNAIGERHTFDIISQPQRQKMRVSLPITQVACGSNHSIALCADGSVHTVGKNFFGQLGIGNKKNVQIDMAVVDSLADVCLVDADDNISMALDTHGRLYVWGYSTHPAIQTRARPGLSDLIHPHCLLEFDKMRQFASTSGEVMKDIPKEDTMFYLQPWFEFVDKAMMEYLISRRELSLVADLLLVQKKFLQSLTWRLRLIDEHGIGNQNVIEKVANFYLSEIQEVQSNDRSDLVPAIITLIQWMKRKMLPLQALESALESVMKEISFQLIKIMKKMELFSAFSPDFLIKVFMAWNENPSRKFEMKTNPYFGEMPRIEVTSDELASELENSHSSTIYRIHSSRGRKVVVFACGHKFFHSVYKNELVPELIRHFQVKKIGDIDAIKSIYSDDKDYFLCPVCVRHAFFP